LSVKIITGLLSGIIIGTIGIKLYAPVDAIANAFVMLLQMTALPYIALSLMVGIGGLSPYKIKTSIKHILVIIFALMSVIIAFILLAPIAFPDWINAAFYNANTTKISTELNLVDLFIPANPFNAFANALIPAVVFFSIFVGVGLMSVKGKKQSLFVLENLQQAVANISHIVMNFAPLGVLCIGWRAAATVDASQIDGLIVYILTALTLVLLLTFIVFPALVAIISPFSYRQILRVSREAMITAFATGSFFVVIPVIIEKTKKLIEQVFPNNKTTNNQATSKVADIIVPITFSLPVGGKLLALLFVLFAAWFSGAHISPIDYIKLLLAGIPQLFGSSTLAMHSLLDLFNVSSAMFDVFVVAENLIVGRLGALLSVIFACCLPLLIVTAMQNKLTFKWRKFARSFVLIPIISILAFLTLRFGLNQISYQYQGYNKFIERDFLYQPVKTNYLPSPSNNAETIQPFNSVLTRVKQRGFIRIGYFRDDLPYSFNNKQGKLVGFDIAIFNQLAIDLSVDLEFVRIFHHQAAPLLASGYLDMTTGIPLIPDNMTKFTLTMPYSEQSLAFLVKAERRAEFVQWQDIKNRADLTIGIPETFFYKHAVENYFTQGKAWEISTPRLFFKEKYQHIDAMLYGAAAASAWNLLHPEYTVVVPRPAVKPLFMAFPINKNDHEFELYMRNWLTMKKQNKTLDKLFDYWIQGIR